MPTSNTTQVVFSKEEKQQYYKIKIKVDMLYNQFVNAYAMLILEHARKRTLPWVSRGLAKLLLPEAVAKFHSLIIYDDGINYNDSRDYRQVQIDGLNDHNWVVEDLYQEAMRRIREKQYLLKQAKAIKERIK